MKPILCATDFSDLSRHGVEIAVGIARQRGCALRLVHVVDLAYATSTLGGLPAAFIESQREAADKRLRALVAEIERPGLEVEGEVLLGGAASAIEDAAESVNPSLIVLATHGRSGMARALLGSTAEAVLQHTSLPVLTVHKADTLLSMPPKRLLVPTLLDGHEGTVVEGAREALGIAPGTTEIHLVHVIEAGAGYARVSGAGWTDLIRRLTERAERRLEATAEAIRDSGFDVTTAVLTGSPAERILEEAERSEPSAIALHVEARNPLSRALLGSSVRRVVQGAACPVLTFREPKALTKRAAAGA